MVRSNTSAYFELLLDEYKARAGTQEETIKVSCSLFDVELWKWLHGCSLCFNERNGLKPVRIDQRPLARRRRTW